jgi:hypothetical protein
MTAIRLLPAQRQVVVQKRDAIFDVIRASKVLNPLKGNDIDAEKSVVALADDGARRDDGPTVVQALLQGGEDGASRPRHCRNDPAEFRDERSRRRRLVGAE